MATVGLPPLHVRAAGAVGAPPMVLLHPNPLDASCWMYQSARFSTWFRCVAVDLPGYGFSPPATDGVTLPALADACWAAVDAAAPGPPAVLVGCSVGSTLAQHMYRRRPDGVRAVVLTGTGHRPGKEFAPRRGQAFRDRGAAYRRDYARDLLSPAFAGTPVARWVDSVLAEREGRVHLPSVLALFRAMAAPDPPGLHADLHAPVLVLTGSADRSHRSAFDLGERLPDARVVTIDGAGHLAFLERPDVFDAHVLAFLREVRVMGPAGVIADARVTSHAVSAGSPSDGE